jgi:hypothetical protein
MLTPPELAMLRLHSASSDIIRDDGSLEFRHLVELDFIRYAEMQDASGSKLYAVTFSGLEALLGYQEDNN